METYGKLVSWCLTVVRLVMVIWFVMVASSYGSLISYVFLGFLTAVCFLIVVWFLLIAPSCGSLVSDGSLVSYGGLISHGGSNLGHAHATRPQDPLVRIEIPGMIESSFGTRGCVKRDSSIRPVIEYTRRCWKSHPARKSRHFATRDFYGQHGTPMLQYSVRAVHLESEGV